MSSLKQIHLPCKYSPSPSPPYSLAAGSRPLSGPKPKLPPTPPLLPPCHNLLQDVFNYITNRTSDTPGLTLSNFSWPDYENFQLELNHPKKTPGKMTDRLRYDYNPQTCTLRVFPISKAAHSALESFLHKSFSRLGRQNIITESEEDRFELGFAEDFNLPFQAVTPAASRRVPVFQKQPDAYIALDDGGLSVFPRVVFEVGFSQSYEEVLDDVRQWLERSEGGVQLAVLIHVEEHQIPGDEPGEKEAGGDSGDSNAEDSGGLNPEMYRRLRAGCAVDHYVGPISAFAELYRYNQDTGVYQVGSRINILSPPDIVPAVAPGHIDLSITDLLPDVKDGRVLRLDLALYARMLDKAREKMALSRMMQDLKKRHRDTRRGETLDPDYVPDGAEGRPLRRRAE